MRTDLDRPLTVSEAANALGLSVHTVRAWIAHRKLAHVRLGRAIRVLPAAIEDLLRSCTVRALDRDAVEMKTNGTEDGSAQSN